MTRTSKWVSKETEGWRKRECKQSALEVTIVYTEETKDVFMPATKRTRKKEEKRGCVVLLLVTFAPIGNSVVHADNESQ
jgi:hypothetical protein